MNLLALSPLLVALVGPAQQQWQDPGINDKLRTNLREGASAKVWPRLDVVAVVRVGSHRRDWPEGSFESDHWSVSVLSKADATGSPVELVQPGVGFYSPALEAGSSYLVLGTLPQDGRDVDLFERNATRHSRSDGQARVYWALPFRGTPPRSGGTREEFFGRAVLAALEGDPQVYKEGLEEFLDGTDPAVLGLTELGGNLQGNHGYGGWRANGFALGLRDWAVRQGARERLFASAALWNLKVTGAMPFYLRSAWEWAALDQDPPLEPGYLWHDRGPGGFFIDLPEDIRDQMLGTAPTPEEWVGRVLALENPKTVEFLLSAGCEGELGEPLRRRMVALLDSPSPRVRWMVCTMYWAWTDYYTQEEMDERQPVEISEERKRIHGPPDYPRLDEHVTFWRAYYR